MPCVHCSWLVWSRPLLGPPLVESIVQGTQVCGGCPASLVSTARVTSTQKQTQTKTQTQVFSTPSHAYW